MFGDMFSHFDFGLLDAADFKEDSVREEIVVPLLRALGYSAGGPARITRSKTLPHPFVYLGSTKNRINVIPDYILSVDGLPRWVLDAKAPGENVHKGKHPEQAFSYAIHPDVRVNIYALCNGRQLTVFQVSKIEPILVMDVPDIPREFTKVLSVLSPLAFTSPHVFRYSPDFGLYLRKLGLTPGQGIAFNALGVPMVAKVEDGLYTMTLDIRENDEWMAATFDFDDGRLEQLLQCIPEENAHAIRYAIRRAPFKIYFRDEHTPVVGIQASLGGTVHSNEREQYCPLIVDRFTNRWLTAPAKS